jgi:hypothetical protein
MHCLLRACLLVTALASAATAEARIGDSEAQLVARFGSVQARRPEPLLEQGRVFVLGERVVLKKQEWRVTAVLIDGHCAKITYGRAGAWKEQHYRDLLAQNADRWAWNEIPSAVPKWQRTWRRSDGLVAKWMYAGGLAIEGQPFVDARDRAREMARREPTGTASQ